MGKMVVVEGVMGVGKTTLLHQILREIHIPYVEQDFEHNICLDDFYAGADCVFPKQMIFLFSNFHILNSAESNSDCFFSDFCFERSLIMSINSLMGKELSLYEESYLYLKQKLTFRKMLIFLYGDDSTILDNIQKRGRPNEKNVTLEYIESCQRSLLDGIYNIDSDEVITININEVDILSQEFVEDLSQRINKFLSSE